MNIDFLDFQLDWPGFHYELVEERTFLEHYFQQFFLALLEEKVLLKILKTLLMLSFGVFVPFLGPLAQIRGLWPQAGGGRQTDRQIHRERLHKYD